MSSLQAQDVESEVLMSRDECLAYAARPYAAWRAEVAAQGGAVTEEVAA